MALAKRDYERWEYLNAQAVKHQQQAQFLNSGSRGNAERDNQGGGTSKELGVLMLNLPQRFHENCDNKGATLLLVKAN